MSKKDFSILIVDDDKDVITTLEILLRHRYRSVSTEPYINNLPSRLREVAYDLILLDMNFRRGMNDGQEGLYWLGQIKKQCPDTAIVLITAYGDVRLAVEAMKRGAADFVQKPWTNDKLLGVLDKVLAKNKPLRDKGNKGPQVIGRSLAMQQVFATIDKVAATEANVLILGENGTGKSLIAQQIHRQSNRSAPIFVEADLGALPEQLFESELFGHEKGAFTDAHLERVGRFAQANGGTLFLDEIGNLPLALQSKLLTVLQNRKITRLGSEKEEEVDFRLICATNQALHEKVKQQSFRQDLFFRINTIEIVLPSLRERREDIELLYAHFITKFEKKYLKPKLKTENGTLEKLKQYHWPGNIRELENSIERAVIMCDNNSIRPDDFILSSRMNNPQLFQSFNLAEIERLIIQQAIEKHQGNLSQAAKELGLTRSSLYRRLEKHDL